MLAVLRSHWLGHNNIQNSSNCVQMYIFVFWKLKQYLINSYTDYSGLDHQSNV